MRLAVTLSLLCACGHEVAPSSRVASIDLALLRGGSFLVTRQGPDGAIRSRTYSALKDGWSVTPIAALALRMISQDPWIAVSYRRAVDFVATTVGPDGAARTAEEVSYPLYAYAIGALVLGAPDNRRHRIAHAALIAALRRYQMTEPNGWRGSDASYGGWGYAPHVPRRPAGAIGDDLLTANLSATLLSIGALALGGAPADDPALIAAHGFVERCQNQDGGFVFSHALPDGNKAGPSDGGYRSYGSMSADGLRALIRLGTKPDDPRIVAAIAYLERTFDPARNPGEFPPVAEVRRESSYYYWAWSAAHVIRHLHKPRWAAALADELMHRQRMDGSWRNPASEMREDDPIVATSFAIAALAIARSVITGQPRSHAY